MSNSVEIYRSMRRIRKFEERLMTLKDSGNIPGSIHLCNGQEAIPVGVNEALTADDYVTATYRGHGWAIMRGTPLVEMFAEIMGRNSSIAGGRAASPYLSNAAGQFLGENSIVGAGLPIAAGAALTANRQNNGRVSVVTLGDGSLNQGATHEALNMAAVMALPLVIVVENNLYSEMVRIADMTRIPELSIRGAGYGMPAITIDGNDPRRVAEVAADAVERARNGGGPTLIEAMTARLVGHYYGDVQHYRPAGEVAAMAAVEPLVRFRATLEAEGISPEHIDSIDSDVAAEVEAAAQAALGYQFPDVATVKDHVYAS